jgi:hypothetical protein
MRATSTLLAFQFYMPSAISTDVEQLQEEVEFWHSVHELRDSMFEKCVWIPGLSARALQELHFGNLSDYCSAVTNGRSAMLGQDPPSIEDPNQLELP